MPEWIVKVLTALMPPLPGSGEPEVYRWRVAVAFVTGGTFIMSSLHIVWACGLLAWAGMPGFVQAGDLDGLKKSQNDIAVKIDMRLTTIERNQRGNTARGARSSIVEFTEKACAADTQEQKVQYTQLQQQALSDWYDATGGQPFAVPRCEQLVTATRTPPH